MLLLIKQNETLVTQPAQTTLEVSEIPRILEEM